MRDPSNNQRLIRRVLLPVTALELFSALLAFIAGRTAFGIVFLVIAAVLMVVWITLPSARPRQ